MASLIHIAEVAAILALAYTLGWVIGFAARRLTAPKSIPAAIPEARLAAVTAPAAEALVKAPVIAPLPAAPAPAPEPEPVAEPVAAEAPAPAVAAVVEEAAPLAPPPAAEPVPVPEPVAASPAESAPASTPAARAIRRFRPAPLPSAPEATAPEPASAPFLATPASRPGLAWSGEIKGKPALPHAELVTQRAPVPPLSASEDEDAAMRAIEGGWSRTGARALADAPELSDMGAAVAAATTAVEQVLARAGIDGTDKDAAKPHGLSRPRDGGKDDLKRINGLGVLDESTLNNLGVFHYDQIAAWDAAQVAWMEDHVFARGRIGREEWQRQALELSTRSAA